MLCSLFCLRFHSVIRKKGGGDSGGCTDCKGKKMEPWSYSEIDDTVVQFGVLVDSRSAFLNKHRERESVGVKKTKNKSVLFCEHSNNCIHNRTLF